MKHFKYYVIHFKPKMLHQIYTMQHMMPYCQHPFLPFRHTSPMLARYL